MSEPINPDAGPLSKLQKEAMKKIRVAEAEYLKAVTLIAKNLLANTESFKRGKEHVMLSGMLFIRSISKPNEKY